VENRDIERAEVFDALGHPMRIGILKLLSREPLSFADLKKKTQIDSSGHLQHHLTKLDGLIKTDEHGKYCLSDVGNDALFAMQTVETASRRGERSRGSYSLRARTLLNIAVLALAVCMIVSAFYLSNYGSFVATQALQNAQNQLQNQVNNVTQYAKYVQNESQNEYVCDIMTGSLNEQGGTSTGHSEFFNVSSQDWFNYTAIVLPENMTTHVLGLALENVGTYFLSGTTTNSTYYDQSFLVFNLEVYGPNPADLYRAHTLAIAGPDGWNGQVVWPNDQDIPPYHTEQTTGYSTGYLYSGGAPLYFEYVVPINVFGNYTFAIRNDGNSTLQVSYSVTQPEVTLQTEPLRAETFPAWDSQFAQERIVRIRQSGSALSPPTIKPITSLAVPTGEIIQFLAYTLAISSTVLLTALTIAAINRKRARQSVF
jgi:DNA-binding transcriptional ArsR family regulator